MIHKFIVRAFFIIALHVLTAGNLYAQQYEAKWSSLNQRQVPQWWSDAKFGIFVHWGLYSVPAYAPVDEVDGVYEKYAEHYLMRLIEKNKHFTEYQKKNFGENSTYRDFAPLFKAEFFEPDKWADLFKKSGAGYVVLTSKHHDGFCLWPSAQSKGWNSVDIGPKRDLIKDLSTSVRKAGMRFGLYYSLLEWANPLYTSGDMEKWTTQYMIPQMKDLVNTYKPEIIFSDGEWDYTSDKLKSEEFLAWLYNVSPVKNSVVVNDRWGKETRSKHGGYYTTEYNLIGEELSDGKIAHPWEESRGIGTSYGYNQFETTAHYYSSKQLIDLLIEKVGNGGNLLLNVGPTANGLIPVIMEQRLLDIGKWLEVNGDAIYGTRAWKNRPDTKESGVYYTKKGNDLYVICTKWPSSSFTVPGIAKASTVELLGSDIKVKHKLAGNNLTIYAPAINPGNAPCDYAWVFKVSNFQ
ncbi:alpha-L-fucosidase [Pseudoxanthomonas sp. SGD-10]|nr:alpha-L-fucosidase [Pseudoxanthomonas sp. SGD-10]